MPSITPVALRIKPLSALLASQIAAGEVVERPASVVKELVENALDAGASRIAVDLELGGTELVRISDDGQGIHPDDLPLAVAPHATSKVFTPEDLDRIATLGFRGEALASIASVSRYSIRSRTAENSAATVLEGEGGQVQPPRPAAGPVGTSITIRTLFFNTPARRKFLKTVATEQGRCLDTLRELALARPHVSFAATCDGRSVLDLPPAQSPRERAVAILGKELSSELLDVSADQFDDHRGIALWGLVGRPSLARATNKSQHIFVNGRAIRDRTIQHALAEAFRGLIEPSRYPTAVLMLEMSPQAVDVNVHPAKAEVRFRDGSLIHGTVLQAVRRTLRAHDLTPNISPSFQGNTSGPNAAFGQRLAPIVFGDRAIQPQYLTPSSFGGTNAAPPTADSARAFADFFRRTPHTQSPISYDAIRTAMQANLPRLANETAHETSYETPSTGSHTTSSASAAAQADNPPFLEPKPASRILQVHKSFLLTQDEHGVLIIDQHALHERVMFEHLLARVLDGGLESQRLLTPVAVPCTPSQLAKLDELRPLLERLGVHAEPLGPKTLAVHAFPTFLFDRGVDPLPFITDLLERAESDSFVPGDEQTLREVLDMMACKAAVKAGDQLSESELGTLVALRDAVERSSNCPHGRPTSIRLTIKELEKLFGRT